MIKLRTILQSKLLITILIVITILWVSYKVKNMDYEKNRLGHNEIVGIIKDIDDKSITINDVIIYTDTNNLSLGIEVSCVGEVTLPSSNTNFNLFNYQNYLASKRVFYTMSGDCTILNEETSLIYKIKNNLINRINNMNSGRYIKAFVLGITDDIDEITNENYRLNGISHLFSISGMHISFIIGILSFIRRKYVIAAILIFYLILLGFPSSMTRAVIFFVILMINKNTKLNIKNVYLFLYLIIFMLLYNPYNIYNIGFVYSYLISFFLILYSEYLDSKNYFFSTFKISILIFIITIPINIQNNFYLNLIAPLLNVVFIPFVSFLLFPLSFITMLFPFFDSGYNLLCMLMENLSNWCALNISLIFPFHKMNFITFIGYYVIIVFIMHKIRFKEYKYIVVIIIVLGLHYLYPNFKSDGMVLMLDVGQGDSTLITYPYNKLNILVDTGGYYSSKIVKNVTIPTLRSLGISELDYLILSHGDYDHAGETINLLENYKVNKVLLNKVNNSDLENSIISYMDKNSIPYEFISDDIVINNNIKLQFLNSGSSDNENDDSLVLYLNINNYKMLMMGDASKIIENEILEEYNLPKMDILKVGHHGSNTSSGESFINNIRPKVSIISAGVDNSYGHPHQEVLKNLQLSDTYVTSIDGAIKIVLGDSMLVQTVR